MKLSNILFISILAAPALSLPISWGAIRRAAAPDAATITALAPPLGFNSGVNPTGFNYHFSRYENSCGI
jgi:hypothetical protein